MLAFRLMRQIDRVELGFNKQRHYTYVEHVSRHEDNEYKGDTLICSKPMHNKVVGLIMFTYYHFDTKGRLRCMISKGVYNGKDLESLRTEFKLKWYQRLMDKIK